MRRKFGRNALGAMSVLFSLILVACNCAPTLRYVTVAPTTATVFVVAVGGDDSLKARRSHAQANQASTTVPCSTQQFTATSYWSDGSTKDATSSAGWTSSNPAAATIDATGLASSVAVGTSTIGASLGGASATSTLNVDVLNSVDIEPAGVTIPLGTSQQYTATGSFTATSDGSTYQQDISSLVSWSVAGGTSEDGITNSNGTASIGVTTGLLTTNNPIGDDGNQGQGTTQSDRDDLHAGDFH